MIPRPCVFDRSFDAYEITGFRDAVNHNFFDRMAYAGVLLLLSLGTETCRKQKLEEVIEINVFVIISKIGICVYSENLFISDTFY